MNKTKWEKTIQEFIEKYNDEDDISQSDIEVMFEEGVVPLLEDYYLLKEASLEVAERGLEAFEIAAMNKAVKMKPTPFTHALSTLLMLVNDEETYQ